MLSLVRFWLICVLKPRSKTTQGNDLGFTMIELLISAVVASMIITPILFFVVDVLRTDTQEEIRARSDQELQAAADFIRRDLSQAIYIYDGQGIAEIIENDGNGYLPDHDKLVLLFWKQEFRPNVIPDGSVNRPFSANHCDTRRCDDAQVLSLVAYYLQTGDSDTWSGQARISRLQIRDGVIDPSREAQCTQPPCYIEGHRPDAGFARPPGRLRMNEWRASGPITQPREVLIDYIYPGVVEGLAADHCRTVFNLTGTTDPTEANLLSGNKGSGFFVCVDSARTTALVNLRINAAIRIDPNAETFNRNQEPLFPATSFLVKGLGAFN
ncbi:MAG: hormogonium polysaccharide secretion pseudopilin HpsC [Limnospira sp. PMC 894.15]|nr:MULTISPECIES: hormogonium polysaccharide secretion pseudopilin HpsC [unclassified Limnospira]MDT9186459.1 hormogonium polysaccharide secretion pseudopilin HpsC [Limnospira sp. PMC 894.15]MDT9232439.1 hormogonium polysaccharide secretion pseudopilin HpsC [Limnospira sp. PMC 917.15]MDT9274325.1 hormogonium polysaccharide secretion pseudopilin HpsC [Limnospira sp. PMC 737.11]